MQLHTHVTINGAKVVIRPQAILTDLAEVYRRWTYWSQDFAKKNRPTDRMVFEFNPRTRRLNIKFLAGKGNKVVYPTSRESYFLFDLVSLEGGFLEGFLAHYAGGWIDLNLGAAHQLASEQLQVLSRPEVDRIFTTYMASGGVANCQKVSA